MLSGSINWAKWCWKNQFVGSDFVLAPGRGMRRARREHWPNASAESPFGRWRQQCKALMARCKLVASHRCGTCWAGNASGRINRVTNRNWWLYQSLVEAPHMVGVFVDSPSVRRRFLDRLVIAFDPAHIGRMARYEKAFRQRSTY